ncbi:uncharacterized protein LOC134084609 isoform X1 [Sardina pilchardus]|uniref:uncharacterized protein LOC134084609 isoform X1 n=1 Tax=Sardina pilchardus TaxID=27697 RepID=UPI002E117E96
MTLEDRFSLRDEPTSGAFIVTITDLRAEDAGIYWCVEWCNKAGYINTTAVKMEVEPDGWETTTLPSVSTTSADNKSHFSGPPVMLTVCLTIAALVLGIAVLICIKYRRMRTQGLASTSVNSSSRGDRPVDCVYEEVKDTSHSKNPEDTVLANTQLPTNPSDGPTYSTVQLPTNPSDGPTYSTVSFHKNQEAAAEADVTFSMEQDTCEYSSVKHPTK